MRRIYVWLVLGLTLCALAGTAGTAGATTPHVLTFGIENVGFGDSSTECPEGVITFDMVSPMGALLGSATSCAQTFESTCPPDFLVGCRQRVDAILTFVFTGRGTITARATLRERLLPDFRFLQVVLGRVSGGSGDFAGAAGGLVGGGKISFNPDGSITYDGRWALLLRG